MKQNEQNAPRDTREEDAIVLGVASVETQGTAGGLEANGHQMGFGISEE